jgi:hypothetical protein
VSREGNVEIFDDLFDTVRARLDDCIGDLVSIIARVNGREAGGDMSPAQRVSSFLDLLQLPPSLQSQLDVANLTSLDAGVEHLLQKEGAVMPSSAELLAGSIHVETSDLMLETFVLASAILVLVGDPNAFLNSLPSVAAWLVALYQHCTRLDRKSGELCVYKSLVSRGPSPSGIRALMAALPCRLQKVDSECGLVRRGECRIDGSKLTELLYSLQRKDLALSLGENRWQYHS